MKNKLFLAIVLIVLFVFGILIYDFSDEMDSKLVNHKWYTDNNGVINVLSFMDNKFSYVGENGEKIKEYTSCSSYQFNSNVSMVKVKCDKNNKKIYIVSYDDNKLVINNEGKDESFFSSKELALVDFFKRVNELSDSDYDRLLSVNFNDKLFINYKSFLSLYKGKNTVYIGLITNNINYENVYNYQVLHNLINNSSKKFYLINVDDLSESELKKLNKLTNIDSYEDKLYIYEVKNKNIKRKVTIDTVTKDDIGNYKNI